MSEALLLLSVIDMGCRRSASTVVIKVDVFTASRMGSGQTITGATWSTKDVSGAATLMYFASDASEICCLQRANYTRVHWEEQVN